MRRVFRAVAIAGGRARGGTKAWTSSTPFTDVLAGTSSPGRRRGRSTARTSEVRAARLVERVCELVNAFRYNAQGAYWVRDKSLVAAFEAGKALAKPGHGRLPTDELRVSLVNYCSTVVEDHEDELTEFCYRRS